MDGDGDVAVIHRVIEFVVFQTEVLAVMISTTFYSPSLQYPGHSFQTLKTKQSHRATKPHVASMRL